MNQKDYKAIAKIIKHCKDEHNLIPYKSYINHLADYFEKEDKKYCLGCCEANAIHHDLWEQFSLFNRKQFLKDCGVEE